MSLSSEKIASVAAAHGVKIIECREIGEGLHILKAWFYGDMVGLHLYDENADKLARISWHGVSIGDYDISTSRGMIIAVCVHPPCTQDDDRHATIMGYKIAQLHSDLLGKTRERVEATADTGAYGFIVVRPGYLFRSVGFCEDKIAFTSEDEDDIHEYTLRSPGDTPIRS